MKKIRFLLVGFVLLYVLVYLAFSFVFADLNANNWGLENRAFMIFIFVCSYFLYSCIILTEIEK
jgi:hypothetical protein